MLSSYRRITTSDYHFMSFLDLLKAILYPIIILLSSYHSSVPSSILGYVEFEALVPEPTLGVRVLVVALEKFSLWSNWTKSGLQEFRIRPDVWGTDHVARCLLDE